MRRTGYRRNRDLQVRTVQDVIARLSLVRNRRAVGLRSSIALRWWKYDRLFREVLRAANHLQELGVGAGNRVILWGPNTPEWVAYFLATAWKGAVAVLVDHRQPASFLERVADEVKSTVVLYDGQRVSNHKERTFASILALGQHSEPVADIVQPATAVVPEDPAAILYTSGTTSTPRGVVLTHGNLASQLTPFNR